MHAGGGGGVLVLGDRLQRVAQHAAVHAIPDPEPHRPDAERDEVPGGLAGELQRVERAAALVALRRVAERAAGVIARGGDDLQHDAAQRQRDQREVVAGDLEAKAGIGHHRGEHGGGHQGQRDAEPGAEAGLVPGQRRHVGAHAHEAAVPERGQAEPSHDRPRRVGERPDQDDDQDVQRIGRGVDERQPDQGRAGQPGQHAGHERRAISPWGRMNIITMKNAKAST